MKTLTNTAFGIVYGVAIANSLVICLGRPAVAVNLIVQAAALVVAISLAFVKEPTK